MPIAMIATMTATTAVPPNQSDLTMKRRHGARENGHLLGHLIDQLGLAPFVVLQRQHPLHKFIHILRDRRILSFRCRQALGAF